ncbi:MAG TPA: DUF3530 family protein [Cellvibrio sp.]|nr:DUF3530 family protein [Cellvibrio sp.]
MPKLFSSDQLICQIVLLILLGWGSALALAQTAPPATPEVPAPAAPVDPNAPPADPNAPPAAQPLPEKPVEKPLYASPAERDNSLLANARPDEALWLETPNEKIVALHKLGETRKAKGSLLMLHAPEQPQLWPATLETLRRNLPLYGWETLAVPLPQKYPSPHPERDPPSSAPSANSSASSTEGESASSAAPSQETGAIDAGAQSSSAAAASSAEASSSEPAKPLLPREQLINERVEAAIKELNKNGQFNTVVLVDNSSAVDSLAGLYKKINTNNGDKETIDGPLQALILVNMQDQEPLSKEQLGNIFAVEALPIMDVFFSSENQQQMDMRRLHRAEAMRKNVKHYRQIVLPAENIRMTRDTQGFWLEKVRGFMEKQAEGKEIKVKAE